MDRICAQAPWHSSKHAANDNGSSSLARVLLLVTNNSHGGKGKGQGKEVVLGAS